MQKQSKRKIFTTYIGRVHFFVSLFFVFFYSKGCPLYSPALSAASPRVSSLERVTRTQLRESPDASSRRGRSIFGICLSFKSHAKARHNRRNNRRRRTKTNRESAVIYPSSGSSLQRDRHAPVPGPLRERAIFIHRHLRLLMEKTRTHPTRNTVLNVF